MTEREIRNQQAVAIILITFIKRLEAHKRPLPHDSTECRNAILLRLFFDREIQNHKEWIKRKP